MTSDTEHLTCDTLLGWTSSKNFNFWCLTVWVLWCLKENAELLSQLISNGVVCRTAPAELLKAAIMQSCDCAKYLRICSNVWLMNMKQKKLTTISCICHNLTKNSNFTCFYVIFNVIFCAKFSIRSFWLQEKNCIYKVWAKLGLLISGIYNLGCLLACWFYINIQTNKHCNLYILLYIYIVFLFCLGNILYKGKVIDYLYSQFHKR